MTKQEALDRLTALKAKVDATQDREVAHYEADEILLELINDTEIYTAYSEIPKGYT